MHKAVYGLAMGHRRDLDYSKYSLMYKIFVGGLANRGKIDPYEGGFWLCRRRLHWKDKTVRVDLRYYSNYQPDYLYVTLRRNGGGSSGCPLKIRF